MGMSLNPHPEHRSVGIETRVLMRTRRVVAIYFPFFGARCDRALAAAVFEALLVRPSRSTLEAALAARELVLRDAATVAVSLGSGCTPKMTHRDEAVNYGVR